MTRKKLNVDVEGHTKKLHGHQVRVTSYTYKRTDRGHLGRTAQPFTISGEWTLEHFGYHLKCAMATRHRALGKAVKHYGRRATVLKVNALRMLFTNTKPDYQRRANADIDGLKKNGPTA